MMNETLIQLMDETLDNTGTYKVKSEFEINFGRTNETQKKRLEDWQSPNYQYTRKKAFSNCKVQYQLGYFKNKPDVTAYPDLGPALGVAVGVADNYVKHLSYSSCFEYVRKIRDNENHHDWTLVRYENIQWTAIFYTKRVKEQEFLSAQDHVLSIKEYFIDCIHKMKDIDTKYFRLIS
jgi:hypothetical protein